MGKLVLLSALVAVAAISAPGALGTNMSTLACGDTVVADVVLERSLENCAVGLIVGADDVTIDLHGHTITGLGTDVGVGIEAVGRTGTIVKGGRIRDFATGIRLQDAVAARIEHTLISRTRDGIVVAGVSFTGDSYAAQIVGNTVKASVAGIVLVGDVPSRVVGNRLVRLADAGIFCNQTFGAGVLIAGNLSLSNDVGIRLLFCDADVVGNVASFNRSGGILRTESAGLVQRNTANGNGGDGIVADDSHGPLIDNTTSRNAGVGLSISDTIPSHGPFHTVTGHVANGNGGLGIFTALEGVIDGGDNRARRNGDPRQCVGVSCG